VLTSEEKFTVQLSVGLWSVMVRTTEALLFFAISYGWDVISGNLSKSAFFERGGSLWGYILGWAVTFRGKIYGLLDRGMAVLQFAAGSFHTKTLCSRHYSIGVDFYLTRSSANAEEPCEHTVSWNRVKYCINVRRIAFEKACNLWMTFKVIQGHCCCCNSIGDILFPISLPL